MNKYSLYDIFKKNGHFLSEALEFYSQKNKTISVYHLTGFKGHTNSELDKTALSITGGLDSRGNLFKPGHGDMYGRGLYTCYRLNKKIAYTYGNTLLEFKVPVQNFLVFVDDEAEAIHGESVSLDQQFLSILERKGIDYQSNEEFRKIIESFCTYLKRVYNEKIAGTSTENFNRTAPDCLSALRKFSELTKSSIKLKHLIDGVMFYGAGDGPVCVVFNTQLAAINRIGKVVGEDVEIFERPSQIGIDDFDTKTFNQLRRLYSAKSGKGSKEWRAHQRELVDTLNQNINVFTQSEIYDYNILKELYFSHPKIKAVIDFYTTDKYKLEGEISIDESFKENARFKAAIYDTVFYTLEGSNLQKLVVTSVKVSRLLKMISSHLSKFKQTDYVHSNENMSNLFNVIYNNLCGSEEMSVSKDDIKRFILQNEFFQIKEDENIDSLIKYIENILKVIYESISLYQSMAYDDSLGMNEKVDFDEISKKHSVKKSDIFPVEISLNSEIDIDTIKDKYQNNVVPFYNDISKNLTDIMNEIIQVNEDKILLSKEGTMESLLNSIKSFLELESDALQNEFNTRPELQLRNDKLEDIIAYKFESFQYFDFYSFMEYNIENVESFFNNKKIIEISDFGSRHYICFFDEKTRDVLKQYYSFLASAWLRDRTQNANQFLEHMRNDYFKDLTVMEMSKLGLFSHRAQMLYMFFFEENQESFPGRVLTVETNPDIT